MTLAGLEPIGVVCCVIAAVCFIPVIWVVAVYNRFARLTQHVRESWSGVDVELKRRHDLVPNLVATVKGYATHERETLELVVTARARAVDAGDSMRERVDGEAELGRSIGRLIALAESYPQLKADQHYLELQRELALTEDRIAACRRFFNANVREINALRAAFPSNLIGGAFGFSEEKFFELSDASERAAAAVKF